MVVRRTLAVLSLSLLVSLPVPAALNEQETAELAAVFTTMSNVLDLANEVEISAARHGRLPNAKSPSELSRLVLGTDSAKEYFVDGWGTPLRLDSDPDRGTYLVAAAGADRAFQEASWAKKAETRSAAEDVVLRDGQWVRSPEAWALTRIQSGGFDAGQALAGSLETGKAARTAADMRVLHTAIAAFEADHRRFPGNYSTDSLARDLVPKYVQELPRADAWGTPFTVRIVEATKSIRIISAGSDAKFDADRWSEKTKTTDYTRDLLLFDGKFEGEWDLKPAGQELARAFSALVSFKARLAMTREMSPERRAAMRAAGLAKETAAALDQGDWRTALARYEEALRTNPGFRDIKVLSRLAGAFLIWDLPPAPGAPPEPPKPTVRTDEGMRAAAIRAAALLAEAWKEQPDDWDAVSVLNHLYRDLGNEPQSYAVLDLYLAAHPQDLRAHRERLSTRWKKMPFDDAIASLDVAAKVADAQTREAVLVASDAFAKAQEAGVPKPVYTAMRQRAYDIARRATQINPDESYHWILLSQIARQIAKDDPRSPDASRYQEEGDMAWAKARKR